MVHAEVGKRTEKEAKVFILGLLGKLSGPRPLFTSDELPHYKTVLAESHSTFIPVPPTGKRGRPRNPIRCLDPELMYATVHKERKNGRVIKVEQRIIFGKERDIIKVL